jgi:hypothetical protein
MEQFRLHAMVTLAREFYDFRFSALHQHHLPLADSGPPDRERIREAARVSLLVAPWELGQLYMGSANVLAVVASPRELEVRVAANTAVQLGLPKGQAAVEVQGKFMKDEKGWSQLLSGWEDENARLTRVYKRLRLD